MRILRYIPILLLPMLAILPARDASGDVPAAPPPAKQGKSYEIPFKTTIPKHIVVRAKINGKGPYNFILDTGAPALYIHTKIAEKAGLKGNAKKWATIDR